MSNSLSGGGRDAKRLSGGGGHAGEGGDVKSLSGGECRVVKNFEDDVEAEEVD